LFINAQTDKYPDTKLIDFYLDNDQTKKADSVLSLRISTLEMNRQTDSLIDCIYYVGKVKLELSNSVEAIKAVTKFSDKLISTTENPRPLRQLYLEQTSFYELIGNPKKAYELDKEALKQTSKMEGATGEDFGMVHSNMGTFAKRFGDLSLALYHHRKALDYYESYPGTKKESIYITYNSIGGMMWFSSKIDSALFYYHKAENILKELEQNPINKYFRPAMLNNNMAAIYGSQGNVEMALQTMKKTITDWEAFLNSDADNVKKESAKISYYQAIENYAGIYKDLGDFQKAKDLLSYSYHEKQKFLDEDSPELFKSKILMGQIHLALKEYQQAKSFLDAGITHIKRIPGNFYFWDADAHYYLATIGEESANIELATENYEKAQLLYEKALQGAYDEIYLEFIIRASYFYAKNGDRERALQMANKTYDYVIENQGEKTLFEFQQVLNLGEIYFVLGDSEMALEKSNLALDLLKNRMYSGNNHMDSVFINFEKPQAILLKTKSAYKLQKIKDTVFLKQALRDIQEAIAILEQRKPYIGNENNLSILIANNNSIFEFAKTLALDLYKQTNTNDYLDILISIHESSLYNRIRSRLGMHSSMAFKDIPETVLEKEIKIKGELKNTLGKENNIKSFFESNKKWGDFLINLKKDYPDYYHLKYASISTELNNIKSKIPKNTTIVRYVFVSNSLFALIINKTTERIFKLNNQDLIHKIAKTHCDTMTFEQTSGLLSQLYNSLWKPFENLVNTEHVIIIPDRELFNLSFEILTPKPIKSFHELTINSLLANYSISYNYSLFLLNKEKGKFFEKNLIAFAPEFTDEMKHNYTISISDSSTIDKTYLNLLPQPFCAGLAKSSTELFDGTSFLNEHSTKQVFKSKAKEHKIIHIATHAESNNLSPELSRIIFAKSISNDFSNEENSFYTYEIYDCDLASNLTILTACETGKPGYQPGEGMISLAHAFNYAGSESILTSLWRIDEKSSMRIVELFYKYLSNGNPKDKALQQAKLEYLASEEGRTLSPRYWAGLILIGNTTPISISKSNTWMFWLFGILVFLSVSFFVLRRKK
jgi:CHAT domain-containing protein